MNREKRNLKILLQRLKQEATGYILAYDPRGKTDYACRAWRGDIWFHGYGASAEEAVEDCLRQLNGQEKEKALSQTEEK